MEVNIELDWVFDEDGKKIGIEVKNNPDNFQFDGISLWDTIPVEHNDVPGEAGEAIRICRGIYKIIPAPETETGILIELDYTEDFEL